MASISVVPSKCTNMPKSITNNHSKSLMARIWFVKNATLIWQRTRTTRGTWKRRISRKMQNRSDVAGAAREAAAYRASICTSVCRTNVRMLFRKRWSPPQWSKKRRRIKRPSTYAIFAERYLGHRSSISYIWMCTRRRRYTNVIRVQLNIRKIVFFISLHFSECLDWTDFFLLTFSIFWSNNLFLHNHKKTHSQKKNHKALELYAWTPNLDELRI